jgi:hypothetical protein
MWKFVRRQIQAQRTSESGHQDHDFLGGGQPVDPIKECIR